MKDLKFEQKRSLSRLEAADQLAALADALRQGGDAELELGPGTLSLRIPDDLRSEIEIEAGNGEIELEIEFTWSTAPIRKAPARAAEGTEQAVERRRSATPAKPGRSSTAGRSTKTKRTAVRTP